MPVLPFLTDTRAALEKIVAVARDLGVDYLIGSVLHLAPRTRYRGVVATPPPAVLSQVGLLKLLQLGVTAQHAI